MLAARDYSIALLVKLFRPPIVALTVGLCTKLFDSIRLVTLDADDFVNGCGLRFRQLSGGDFKHANPRDATALTQAYNIARVNGAGAFGASAIYFDCSRFAHRLSKRAARDESADFQK
jgi:hypothetical protein